MVGADHLVYATLDVEVAIDRLEQLLGVRAAAGGRHPGLGTRNALLSLGPATYLEIVGPDPAQASFEGSRPFRIDELGDDRLVTWAARTADVYEVAARDLGGGAHVGAVRDGRRQRPDGMVLEWRFTDPRTVVADGLVPFFIDWGSSPHPAATAPAGCALIELRGEHPVPAPVAAMLATLGLEMNVRTAGEPALVATIATPRGRVELR